MGISKNGLGGFTRSGRPRLKQTGCRKLRRDKIPYTHGWLSFLPKAQPGFSFSLQCCSFSWSKQSCTRILFRDPQKRNDNGDCLNPKPQTHGNYRKGLWTWCWPAFSKHGPSPMEDLELGFRLGMTMYEFCRSQISESFTLRLHVPI